MAAVAATLTPDFEIILVDDGSPDDSWNVIESLATRDPRVRGILLSRNFGQPHAYFHRGLCDEQLARWLARFPAEQLLYRRSYELLKDTGRGLYKVFRFLGVGEGFRPEPFRDFSSPDVIDRRLQCRLRQENGAAFDAAIQRLREGKSPRTELDQAVRTNERPRLPCAAFPRPAPATGRALRRVRSQACAPRPLLRGGLAVYERLPAEFFDEIP